MAAKKDMKEKSWRTVRPFSFRDDDNVRLSRLVERAESLGEIAVRDSRVVRAALLLLEDSTDEDFKRVLEQIPRSRYGRKPSKKNKSRFELTDEKRERILREHGLL